MYSPQRAESSNICAQGWVWVIQGIKNAKRSKRKFTPAILVPFPSLYSLPLLAEPCFCFPLAPWAGRIWKNKLRRKGQGQKTTSSNTHKRCADAAAGAATWAFAQIMNVWCRRFTYRPFFFWAETEQVSLTLECGGTVLDLCQVNQEKKGGNLMPWLLLTSYQRPHTTHKTCASHVTFHPPAVRKRGQRHHFWRLRSEYSPAGRAEWLRTDGGVQRSPVPKLHLSTAHLHRWGEKYFNCDKRFNNCRVPWSVLYFTETHAWSSLTGPNFDCSEFFWLRPTASLTVWKIWDE